VFRGGVVSQVLPPTRKEQYGMVTSCERSVSEFKWLIRGCHEHPSEGKGKARLTKPSWELASWLGLANRAVQLPGERQAPLGKSTQNTKNKLDALYPS